MGNPAYSVTGLAVGTRVQFDSEAYPATSTVVVLVRFSTVSLFA